jgi:hypothetical protein
VREPPAADSEVRAPGPFSEAWDTLLKDLNVPGALGSIFGTLLPGVSARLDPDKDADGNLTGLGVRVAFNGVWKESLTELSGGQRSLLALSLILALLLFKPAPMYILDEVDAALDLSHTQNIGAMIRQHFKNSQFIVVSLKQDMFNNANVIFRTKFVDGERRADGGGPRRPLRGHHLVALPRDAERHPLEPRAGDELHQPRGPRRATPARR